MSHPEHLLAHAQHMRARAAVLCEGDEEARRHASDLERQAKEIDQQIGVQESGE